MNAVTGWAYDTCGFARLALTMGNGPLGAAPAAARPGPLAVKFAAPAASPGSVVLLAARVKDGRSASTARPEAANSAWLGAVDILGGVDPGETRTGYTLLSLTPGSYILAGMVLAGGNSTRKYVEFTVR